MKRRGLALLAVAIVAIGMFALPSSVSLFSGQHTWYDLSASGRPRVNNVPCEKCHAEIAEEMGHGDNGVHRDLTCAMCHRAPFTGYTFAIGSYSGGPGVGAGSKPGQEAHAASTVECMACHGIWKDLGRWNHWSDGEYAGACNNCHKSGYADFISAGGFGIEDPGNPGHTTTDYDTGEKAAHRKFVLDSMSDPLMDGANEACIACHTRIGVNITWTKNKNLEFNASEDETGVWTIPSFAAGGSDVVSINWTNEWAG